MDDWKNALFHLPFQLKWCGTLRLQSPRSAFADTPTPVLCPCQRYRVNNGLAIELLAKFAEEFIEHLLTRCLHKP